jgi:hypothetical protein
MVVLLGYMAEEEAVVAAVRVLVAAEVITEQVVQFV